VQLEFKTIESGLFTAGLTLRELLVLPPFSAATHLRLVKYDDIDPLEKKAKSLGLKIAWSGDEPLELSLETIVKLVGNDKWSTLEIEAGWDASPGRAPVVLSGWENRYWKLQGLAEVAAFIKPALMQRLDLKPPRAAEITALMAEWLEPGVFISALPNATIRIAALLRSRSRVYLGLPPGPFREIALRVLKPGDSQGVATRVSLLSILTLEQTLYDQLALGAALIFLLAALACAALATFAWKQHWIVTGVLFALGFLLTAVYGMKLAGARED
jgi:hypothetical protein